MEYARARVPHEESPAPRRIFEIKNQKSSFIHQKRRPLPLQTAALMNREINPLTSGKDLGSAAAEEQQSAQRTEQRGGVRLGDDSHQHDVITAGEGADTR